MAKILCGFYLDPEAGFPPVDARDEIPPITRYAKGQTAAPTNASLGLKPGELVGCVSGERLRPYVTLPVSQPEWTKELAPRPLSAASCILSCERIRSITATESPRIDSPSCWFTFG